MTTHHDPWADAALDDAIRTTLAVEPSAGFQARVRDHIGREPAPQASTGTGKAVGLALAAGVAATIAFIALYNQEPTPPRTVATAIPAAPMTAPAAPLAQPPAPTVPPLAKPTVTAGRLRENDATPAPAAMSAEPEVLIDRREVLAFQRLLVSLDPERIDLRTLQREIPPATEPLPVVAQLSVEPVVVSQLN